ncbi:unnamed protein product [Echinostoma caproni]|uniref:Uncharacterized protein n=1 Tax=Echinostoma caproni TaxID=27848 RepID=A0A183AY44_9TREM|nr:unnamed protein product [Echinostoma caproni]
MAPDSSAVWYPPSIGSTNSRRTSVILSTNGSTSVTAIDWLHPSPQLLVSLMGNHTQSAIPVGYKVHTFYYAWYNSPEPGKPPTKDRHWVHWNHPRLPHWIGRIAQGFSTEPHNPPDDVASSYLPKIGLYASADPEVIRAHLLMLRFAGIDTLLTYKCGHWLSHKRTMWLKLRFPFSDLLFVLSLTGTEYIIETNSEAQFITEG